MNNSRSAQAKMTVQPTNSNRRPQFLRHMILQAFLDVDPGVVQSCLDSFLDVDRGIVQYHRAEIVQSICMGKHESWMIYKTDLGGLKHPSQRHAQPIKVGLTGLKVSPFGRSKMGGKLFIRRPRQRTIPTGPPLLIAAHRGDAEIVQAFLEHGVEVGWCCPRDIAYCTTLLDWCIWVHSTGMEGFE